MPMDRPGQFLLATSVEPKAPLTIGIFRGIPPTSVSVFAFPKSALSESASIPFMLKSYEWMLMWEQSNPKSFNAPAVLVPNSRGSGYSASRPRKVERLISQSIGQSRMQIGHIPLVGLTSFTLVFVPQVDLPFR